MLQETFTLFNVSMPLKSEGLYEVTIENGVIKGIVLQGEQEVRAGSKSIADLEEGVKPFPLMDAEGRCMLPSFCDIHMHLDKAFTFPLIKNKSGRLVDACQLFEAQVPTFTYENYQKRMLEVVERCMKYGTTKIRSHVNFVLQDYEKMMIPFQALYDVKKMVEPYVELQIVPMFYNMECYVGEYKKAIDTMLEKCDVIGGVAHLSNFPSKDIDWIFEQAKKYNKPIDMHTDEEDDPSCCTLQQVIDLTEEYGMQGRVTVGHITSLAAMEDQRAEELIQGMKRVGISVVTLPGANMYLQGRDDRGLVRRGPTRIREIMEGGVTIATSSDNIQDPFHPFGKGDLLQIALLTAYCGHFGNVEEQELVLDMITTQSSKIFGDVTKIEEGQRASFVIVGANSVPSIFAEIPVERYVYNQKSWIGITKSQSYTPSFRKLINQ